MQFSALVLGLVAVENTGLAASIALSSLRLSTSCSSSARQHHSTLISLVVVVVLLLLLLLLLLWSRLSFFGEWRLMSEFSRGVALVDRLWRVFCVCVRNMRLWVRIWTMSNKNNKEQQGKRRRQRKKTKKTQTPATSHQQQLSSSKDNVFEKTHTLRVCESERASERLCVCVSRVN